MILLQPSLLWTNSSGLSREWGRGNVQVERGQLERPPGSSLRVPERWHWSVGWDRICVGSVLVWCSSEQRGLGQSRASRRQQLFSGSVHLYLP